MAYIGTQPKDVRSFGKAPFDFTATASQTVFSGADDDGKTLGFTTGQIQVYVNGILMDASDYTTSNGNTVTLASAANANDIITVVALQTDIPNSDYVPATGGTFSGDVTHTGSFTSRGIDDNATSTAMTLDASGNLLLGVTASAGPLTIGKSPPASDIMIDVGNTKYNSTSSSGESKIRFGWENHTGANIAAYKASVNLTGFKFYAEYGYNNPQLVLTVLPDGNLNPEGGIYLGGATGSNLLNDYEEGTWTVTVTNGTVNNSAQATYTKIGNVVYCQAQLNNFSDTTSAAPVTFNLPFAAFSADRSVIAFSALSANVTGIVDMNGYLDTTTNMRIYASVTGAGYDYLAHSDLNSISQMYMGFSYFAA